MGKARIVALSGTLLLSACAGESAAPPARPVTILPSAAMALAPAIYLQLASAASLFAIRASELAQSQARSGGLRSAASAVARDQEGVASQLSFAGRRLDMLPSAVLPPAMAADLQRLHASPDFDSDYRRLVGAALARSLEAHEVFARAGASPTLRPVAVMAAPVTRRDLAAIRR